MCFNPKLPVTSSMTSITRRLHNLQVLLMSPWAFGWQLWRVCDLWAPGQQAECGVGFSKYDFMGLCSWYISNVGWWSDKTRSDNFGDWYGSLSVEMIAKVGDGRRSYYCLLLFIGLELYKCISFFNPDCKTPDCIMCYLSTAHHEDDQIDTLSSRAW